VEAKGTATEGVARLISAQAALDQAVSARDEAAGRLDDAVVARDRALTTLDDTKTALDETKTALEETATARDRALAILHKRTSALKETLAARDRAIAARDEAMVTLDETKATLDDTKATLDDTRAGLDETKATLDDTKVALDETKVALDEARARIAVLEADLETVRADRDAVVAAQTVATATRVDTLDTLAARAEGAVVVLPEVNLPDAEVGPIAPARVSWRPTWSEWAGDGDPGRDAGEPEAAPVPTNLDDTADEAAEIVLDAADDGGVRRYLNVGATIGQLLPADLGPLLLSGATVVRREGRLFATVAITTNPWAAPGTDGAEQAKKLSDAGFRVEWTSTAPLAC
jgi:hypothetical protein